MSKKYFIILGGHDGSVARGIRDNDKYDDFFIYTYEPNPIYSSGYSGIRDMELLLSAAWIYDGDIRFYIGDKKFQGHSIMEHKSNIDKNSHIEVPCIDFSKWIKDNFNVEDYIEIRMDIEGAEYEVLTKMIEDKSISIVNKMYVEFHHYKHTDLDKNNKYGFIMNSIYSNIITEI